jgi:hypothetical protein
MRDHRQVARDVGFELGEAAWRGQGRSPAVCRQSRRIPPFRHGPAVPREAASPACPGRRRRREAALRRRSGACHARRGVMGFVASDGLRILLLALLPAISLWLPGLW